MSKIKYSFESDDGYIKVERVDEHLIAYIGSAKIEAVGGEMAASGFDCLDDLLIGIQDLINFDEQVVSQQDCSSC